jgi:hypothetical protein
MLVPAAEHAALAPQPPLFVVHGANTQTLDTFVWLAGQDEPHVALGSSSSGDLHAVQVVALVQAVQLVGQGLTVPLVQNEPLGHPNAGEGAGRGVGRRLVSKETRSSRQGGNTAGSLEVESRSFPQPCPWSNTPPAKTLIFPRPICRDPAGQARRSLHVALASRL